MDSSHLQSGELYPQKGKSLHYLGIAFLVVTGLALVVRFWSRATICNGKKFGSDDWTALAAWPLVVGLDIVVIMWTRSGLGLHVADVPPYYLEKGLKILYVGYLVYDMGITIIRVSTVCFYRRVFQDHSKTFTVCFWVTIGLNISWFWAIWGISAFSCTPLRAAWDKTIPSKCMGVLKILLASGVTSVLLDFWILILPLPLLWKLQVKLVRKLLIILMFFAGYCIIVFTIGRTVAVFNVSDTLNSDVTWAFTPGLYWFTCEINVAFISICMPSYFHLIRRGLRHGPGSLFNDHDYSTNSSRPRLSQHPSRRDNDEGFVRLTNDGKSSKDRDIQLDDIEAGALDNPVKKGGVSTARAYAARM